MKHFSYKDHRFSEKDILISGPIKLKDKETPCCSEIDAMPQLTMFTINIVVMLRELFQRGAVAILAGEGELELAERLKNILCVFIGWYEKVEYEWATKLLGYNSMSLHDFLFIACCWFFGSVRITCRRTRHNMQPLSLLYFFQVFSSIITALLSALHLFYPHAFATNTNQSTQDHMAIRFFYIVSLSHAIFILAYCYLLHRG